MDGFTFSRSTRRDEAPLKFRSGGHKVLVYSDRVEEGVLFFTSTHYWDEIQAAESGGFFTNFRLRLHDGTTTQGLNIGGDSARCALEINKRINHFRKSMTLAQTEVLIRCTALGGSGTVLEPGLACTIAFGEHSIRVFSKSQLQTVLRIDEVTSLELGGTGRTESGGGFVGGGFGLEGAAIGMAAASILNALTTKSEINTVVRVAWDRGEAFFHTSAFTPSDGRIKLSKTFTNVANANPKAADPVQANETLTAQLEKLAALRAQGVLTEEEFVRAKERLLAS
ncbi:hypothetical protein GCM10027034_19830 [Ramlibacter solisilvae]|uniref:SHOCT domain-containing protein n=1 Tax=Ramlibacter tataouinensis TaxID=94132 RepID=A0A127JVM0_9BURK|nr:SHOCT domain-containing protein [Ramlibacter tataouinensis]AMO23929.1 hypothetical protein UC35_14990 [Ramlibacter tataouinensis]